MLFACEQGGPWGVANDSSATIQLHVEGRTYDIEAGDRSDFSIFKYSSDRRILVTSEDGSVLYDQVHS